MTVGAEEAHVVQSVVEPIAADVIHNQTQRLAEPRPVATTNGALLRHPGSHHRCPQPVRCRSSRSSRKYDEPLLRFAAHPRTTGTERPRRLMPRSCRYALGNESSGSCRWLRASGAHAFVFARLS